MGTKISSKQRQLSLLLALTLPTRALTKQELFKQVLGYQGQESKSNLERMFSRDKQTIEEAGCHITVSKNRQGVECYRIHAPNQNWYQAFTAPERELLQQAMELWNRADGSGTWKIRAAANARAAQPLIAVPHSGLSNPQLMAQMLDAILARKQVTFTYPAATDPQRRETRLVEPWRLLASDSQILLHGWDRQRAAVRHFNLSRIGDFKALDKDATAEVDLSAKFSITQIEPLLAVRAGQGGDLESRSELVGEQPELAKKLNSAGWELRRGRSDTYRHWWQTLLAQAENCVVLEPAYLRTNVVESLQRSADLAPALPADGKAGSKRVRASRKTALGTGSTLELTLALVQWLRETGPATVEEAANHFGVDRQDILQVSEYLAETFFEEDYYWTKINLRWDLFYEEDLLELEPVAAIDNIAQLTVTEARAALIALWLYAHLTLGIHNQVLLPAVAKLSGHLQAENLQNVLVWVESNEDEALRATISQARESKQAVKFDYRTRTGEESARTVLPQQLIYLDGHWVLRGYCYRAQQVRNFRCDRMAGVTLTKISAAESGAKQPLEDSSPVPPKGQRVQVKVDPRWMWALTEERSEGRAAGVYYLNVYDQQWGSDQLLTLGLGLIECDNAPLCQQTARRARQAEENYRMIQRLHQ